MNYQEMSCLRIGKIQIFKAVPHRTKKEISYLKIGMWPKETTINLDNF